MKTQVTPLAPAWKNTLGIIEDQAARRPDAIALEGDGRPSLSCASLLGDVRRLARRLRTAGARRSDRVGIVFPNGPDMATALLAVSATAVSAPLNPVYRRAECEAYLADLGVTLLLAPRGADYPALEAAGSMGIPVLTLAADAPAPGEPASAGDEACADVAAPGDVAIVLHTSGTTARPKVVPLTHRNILVAVDCVCRSLALVPGDRCLSLMPQFHIGGFVDLLLAPLAAGGLVICPGDFHVERFFRWLDQYRPTWYQGVPATLAELRDYAERHGITRIESSLRLIRSVAAPLQPALLQKVESLFSVPVIETFGMTEAAPLVTSTPLPPGRRKPGSVGPSVGPDVAIMDEDGRLLPAGVRGEVVIRGENVMSGYENSPEANAVSFAHGWFHTGDQGFLDEEGYLFLTGRLKEMINRGGEKIAPGEVDAALLAHPAVAQAACFPVPHNRLGEEVAAAVVRKAGREVAARELIEFVAARVALFKVPRAVYFVDDLPKGPTGKVQRGSLARQMAGLPAAPRSERRVAPRTPAEAGLAGLWAKVLRLDQVGIHDGFFDLGGDSLQVVELFLQIEAAFGLAIPAQAIFQFPTVADQARLVESGDEDPLGSRTRRIMRTNRRALFWMQCGFDPGDLPIIPLTTYWEQSPDRDIAGITIEELAAEHVAQIRRHAERGPYGLGGFSAGGLLALEAARQLSRSGEDIILLFLVDPATPGETAGARDAAGKLPGYIRTLSNLVPGKRAEYIRRKAKTFFMLPDNPLLAAACRRCFRSHKPLPLRLRHYYAQKIFSRAIAAYDPPAYPAPVTVYLSRPRFETARARWATACPAAGIRLIDVYDHPAVNRPPWNREWLEDLRSRLSSPGISPDTTQARPAHAPRTTSSDQAKASSRILCSARACSTILARSPL